MKNRFPTFRRILGTRIAMPFVWPRTSAAQRRTLLRLIAVGIEEKLPLAPLIAARAEDERGLQEFRLRRLAKLLEAGTPLADAVEATPGVLNDEDALAIRFDAQSGTKTAAIRDRLHQSQRVPAVRSRRPGNTLMYFAIVLLLGLPVVAFTQIKIVPELNKILHEFEIETPWALDWTITWGNFLAAYWWLGALVILLLMWSAFSARPGRFVRRNLLGRFVEPVREIYTADVLRKVSLAMDAGRPVPGALSTLARYHFDPTSRNKLLFVRNEVEQGIDAWQSMSAVDMLSPAEVRVLETAERMDNRSWALRQLAGGKMRRTAWRLDRLSDLMLPAVVIVLGSLVLIQALSVFLLLTELVHNLARLS